MLASWFYNEWKRDFGIMQSTGEVPKNRTDLQLYLKPAAHESYRLSKSYSSLLAQPIAHRLRVDFTDFISHVTFSSVSNMFDVKKRLHETQNSVKFTRTW